MRRCIATAELTHTRPVTPLVSPEHCTNLNHAICKTPSGTKLTSGNMVCCFTCVPQGEMFVIERYGPGQVSMLDYGCERLWSIAIARCGWTSA